MNAGILAAILGCFAFSVSVAQNQGVTGIEGVITISPVHPGPARVGMSESAPVAKVTFEVKNQTGGTVGSFTTDDQGRFQISLAPGHYTVARADGKPRLGYFGPFDADVAAGKMTQVEWRCDSGMR